MCTGAMAACSDQGGGRRGAHHSPPSPSAAPAHFVIFSSFLPVARRCPAMAGEVVFGLAMMPLVRRGSWVLHKLDKPEQQWRLCRAFTAAMAAAALLPVAAVVTAGDGR